MNDDHLMLEHSVIRIIGKDGKTTCGTGFLVAENIAVTCAHVIGIAGASPGTLVQFKFDSSDEVQWATVDERHFSPGSIDDVAYLILNDLPNHVKPLSLASAKRSDGHPYKSYGYPVEAEPVKARKPTASINGVVPASEPDVQPLLEVKGEEWGHGLSGAPIFDLSYQAVVGMVTQGKKLEKTLLGYATTTDTICLHHPCISLDKAPLPNLPRLPERNILPEPANLPSGSRLPFTRNAIFTGRKEDLHALAEELLYNTDGRSVALTQPVAAAGMGGIGKTQLATEFCYRYGQFCEGVHWINAANADAIGAEIAACGLAMGIQPWSEKQPEQIEATLREWAKSKRRIVVLDNLEEPTALGEWLPKMHNVHVLATTRRVEWPPDLGLRVQRLESFSRVESLRLLRKLCPRLEKEPDDLLGELAGLLCGLPLAVDLAGKYLHERKSLSPRQYIDNLEASGVLSDYAMSDEGANDATRHLKSLESTFEMSWQELETPEGTRKKKEMRFARLAFISAGYCAPVVPIPVDVLREVVKRATGSMSDDPHLEAAFDFGLSHLCAMGLLDATVGNVAIHPLLAEFARNQDATLPEAERVLPVLANVLSVKGSQINNTNIPGEFRPLRPHFENVATYSEHSFPANAADLLVNLGNHSRILADFAGAKTQFERALAIGEKVYGNAHPEMADYSINLGNVLQDLGDFAGAKSHIERALAIDEQVYGPDHPEIATDSNNLGSVLHALGDLAGARAHLERALVIDEQMYGPDHPNVAINANNLGGVLHALGDLVGARAHIERALVIDEQVYGPDHPNVAIDANNLGFVLQDLGDVAGARACFERALDILVQIYGEIHPYVAGSANNLGMILQTLGDPVGAMAQFERAQAIDERVYGKEHPEVAIDYNNLGLVLLTLGDLVEAKKHFEQALAIFVEFMPEDHSNIRLVRGNLAVVEAQLRARG